MWVCNGQYQIGLIEATRCFVFLEMLDVKTDMRDVEGLQAEPAYPSVGFVVCKGRGNHIPLDERQPLEVLFTVPPKKGDGCYLELGALEAREDMYVVIPFTDVPGVEHKFVITLYSDYEHRFEKIDPRLNCECCGNPSGKFKALDTLDRLILLTKRVHNKEHRLATGDDGTNADFFTEEARMKTMPGGGQPVSPSAIYQPIGLQQQQHPQRALLPSGQMPSREGAAVRKFTAADVDLDGDGQLDLKELVRFLKPLDAELRHQGQLQSRQLDSLSAQRARQAEEIAHLKKQLEELGVSNEDVESARKKGSAFCSVM